jgi:ubiquinone/menaquinone biosynthesis C-methylase UbiE/8-oxo-dGTP pyrophosphatase MutT (NUDIX family)
MLKHDHNWVLGFNSKRNGWELPGGHRNEGESLLDAGIREAYEEVGATLENIEFKGFYILENGHKTAFMVADTKTFNPNIINMEISKVKLFSTFPDNLSFKDGLYATLESLLRIESPKKEEEMSLTWNHLWEKRHGYATNRTNAAEDKIEFFQKLGIKFYENERVLEAGCGDASVVTSLTKKFGVDAYGIDISTEALLKAQNKADYLDQHINLQQGDVRNMPYPDNVFNKIISLGVIEHFNCPKSCITEMFRTLQPRGEIILMTPNKNSSGVLDRKLQEIFNIWSFGYQTEYTPNELIYHCEKTGFETKTAGSSLRSLELKANLNMKAVAYIDKILSNVFPNVGFYSWYVGYKP